MNEPSETNGAAIRAAHLTKRFKGRTAVEALNLEVDAGEIVGLVGSNGAGKTTTVRLLLGLEAPTHGRAELLSRPSDRLGPADFQRIGYVPSEPRLPGWMTVKTFLAYLRPMYPSWDQSFCERFCERFALPPGRKIRHLSRGLRARLAVLSAMAFHPGVLLLDEPFAGLDPRARDDIAKAMLGLSTDDRPAVLLATHELDEIERLADRVAFLDAGRLLFHEPVAEVLGRHRAIRIHFAGPVPERLPAEWKSAQRNGSSVKYVETDFRADSTPEQIHLTLPDVKDLSIEELSLRDIFLAHVDAQTSKEQGASR